MYAPFGNFNNTSRTVIRFVNKRSQANTDDVSQGFSEFDARLAEFVARQVTLIEMRKLQTEEVNCIIEIFFYSTAHLSQIFDTGVEDSPHPV